jgi:hypothetical protein
VSEGRTYSSWLASLDDDALAALLTERPEALSRPVKSFNDLATLLSLPMAVDTALRTLDWSAAQVAGVLVALGPTTADAAEAALAHSGDVPAGHIDGALQRLIARGLSWPDGDGRWHVQKAVANAAPALRAAGLPWRTVLERTPLYLLRGAMEALGVGGARSIADATAELSSLVKDPKRVAALLKRAPRPVLSALEHISVDGPQSDLDAEVVAWLDERCLLIGDAAGRATVPAELLAAVRGPRVVGRLRVEPAAAAAARVAPESVLALVDDMRALLELLDRVPIKSLQSGGIGVQEQRRLAKLLSSEQGAVRRLLHLAGDAGLLSTGTKPGLVTTSGAAWLALGEVPAAIELLAAALEAGRAGLDESAPLWGPAWHQPTPGLRQALAALVEHPDRPPLPWLTWRWYGASEVHVAAIVEALEALCLVTSSGVQPWAASLLAGDQPAAEAALAALLPTEQGDVVLQADGTAIVAGRPTAALRHLLDRMATRESERTWRIASDRVRGALDGGFGADQLLDELRRHSRHAVPQVVEQLVRDVAARHGRIVVLPATTLLRVDDEPLAITLLRDKRLKVLGLTEVQPGLLTSPKKPAEVLAALRAAGHAPIGPAETARRRPAPTGRHSSSYRSRNASPADVVRALREAPVDVPPARLATVHPIGTTASAKGARFDHLPVDQRLLLARALTDGRPVEIDYVDTGRRRTTRVVEDLQDLGGLLEGWCRLRDDERNFLPEGIVAVRPSP